MRINNSAVTFPAKKVESGDAQSTVPGIRIRAGLFTKMCKVVSGLAQLQKAPIRWLDTVNHFHVNSSN